MIRVFPVAGPAKFSDDFGAPRSGGRSHQGNDIFAAEGTPVVAVDDGKVTYSTDPIGGPSFVLTASDARYYGAHVSAYVDADGSDTTTTLAPRVVKAGDTIARVGHTGNAAGTPPHLHFQMWIGGQLVDPYEYLVAAQGKPNLPGQIKQAITDSIVGRIAMIGGAVVAAGGLAYAAIVAMEKRR